MNVPESIPWSKLRAFLADLGIDVTHLRELRIGYDGVQAEVVALDAKGKLYLTPGGDIAVHRISMRLDHSA
jgi:hypothetical protein